jgi:glycosyltransferase involved in cell wall biosynthesis
MASIQDGFGMVLTQALACGLPLICTTNTGGEDLLRQGEEQPPGQSSPDGASGRIQEFSAGWVVPIHAPEAIAHCLKRLAREPGLWERKREAALRLARGSLSWEAYGDRAIQHYAALVASRAAAAAGSSSQTPRLR